jgi:hypothetical protein
MIFWITANGYLSTVAPNRLTLGYGLCGIIGSLGMNVRLQSDQKRRNIIFIEQSEIVHRLQGRENFETFILRGEGPSLSLDPPGRGVAVHGYDQDISQSLGLPKIAYVACMKDIETTI